MGGLVRWDESRPGFSDVPAVVGYKHGKIDPSSRTYCLSFQWGVKSKPIGGKKVEESVDIGQCRLSMLQN